MLNVSGRCDENGIWWNIKGDWYFFVNAGGDVSYNGSIKSSSIDPPE
jgi:hypothetical protein